MAQVRYSTRPRLHTCANWGSVDGKKLTNSSIARTIIHELGHTAGLPHVWDRNTPSDAKLDVNNAKLDPSVTDNLMNSDENPDVASRPNVNSGHDQALKLTDGQMEMMKETVSKEQTNAK